MTKFEFLLFFGLNSKTFSVFQTSLSSVSNLGSQEVASSFAKNCDCKRQRNRTPTYLKVQARNDKTGFRRQDVGQP